MECDELNEQMLKEPDQDVDKSSDKYREGLADLAASGKCSEYFGENYTIEKIDNMTDEEIKKLYSRYESRLGATMIKSIGSAMLQLYTVIASAETSNKSVLYTARGTKKLRYSIHNAWVISHSYL